MIKADHLIFLLLLRKNSQILIKSFIHILRNKIYHHACIVIAVKGIESIIVTLAICKLYVDWRKAVTYQFKIENQTSRSAVSILSLRAFIPSSTETAERDV